MTVTEESKIKCGHSHINLTQMLKFHTSEIYGPAFTLLISRCSHRLLLKKKEI